MSGVLKGIKISPDREAVASLKDSFANSSRTQDYSSMAVFDQSAPDKSSVPTAADLSDKTIEYNDVTAVNMDTASGVQSAEASISSSEYQAKQGQYMDMDAEVKSIVIEAIDDVLGPEEGDRFAEHVFPGGAPTKMQAAATMIDPTGVGGSIYSVLNAVAAQADRFGTQETLEILDNVLGKLQESENPAIKEIFNNPKFFPPSADGQHIAAQNLLDFLQRQPEKDPIMQDLQKNLESAIAIEQNQAYNRENAELYDANKLAQAVIAGDEGALKEMTGGDAVTAYAVEMTGLTEPGPMVLAAKAEHIDAQFATSYEVKAGLAEGATVKAPTPVLDSESDVQKLLRPSEGGAFV